MTIICGVATRCERHERALHGYPCHACAEEHWRRYPRTRALIHTQASPDGRLVRPSEVTAARKRDQADRAAYAGPHEPVTERAGEHGPVSRLWNAVCAEGCGWSHYWLGSKTAADRAARTHMDEHRDPAPRTWGPHWVLDTCRKCGAGLNQPCLDLRRRDRAPMANTTHKGRPVRRIDRPEDMPT